MVTLILDGVDLTCTVAPTVFFYRVYECDTQWVAYDEGECDDYAASGTVDTSAAGANVVLAAGSENAVTGSHVARIYKEGTTKKLHKYDGAFYSRMSMNLNGDSGDDRGILTITTDNEGLDSELHLTINGGTISIQSQDDGIDSNGYLTINGGVIRTMVNESFPDGGIDADSAIAIHGGTVLAFGTRNDAVDAASAQPYLEISFAFTVNGGKGVSSVASGQMVELSSIQASVDGLPDCDVQITITDVPSEDYAETRLLSDGAEAAEPTSFSDVASGSWYSGYGGWVAENGIVQGDGQGHFLPDAAVTRAHMERMLTRYAALAGLDYTPSDAPSGQALTRAGLAELLMTLMQD